MIKGLQGGPGLFVDGGSTALPYVNQNSSDSFSGVMRIYGSDIQYYQNGAWVTLPTSYATVRMDGSTESALNWAKAQMAKEGSDYVARQYMRDRAKLFPSLEKALEAVERAEENRDIEVKRAIENFHVLDKIAGQPVDDENAGMMAP
jgi:hypothetical protein